MAGYGSGHFGCYSSTFWKGSNFVAKAVRTTKRIWSFNLEANLQVTTTGETNLIIDDRLS